MPNQPQGVDPADKLFPGQHLNLSKQEKNIIKYHRETIAKGTVGRDERGNPMTVWSTGIRIPEGQPHAGKFVSVPGWDNERQVVMSEEEAYMRWKSEIDSGKWPLYKSGEALNKRSQDIHTVI